MQDPSVTHPPLDGAVNPDTSVFGFPSYLGLFDNSYKTAIAAMVDRAMFLFA